MQTKSAAYFAALAADVAEWRYGVDILAADENTPLEDTSVYDSYASDRLVPKSAAVTLDTSAKVMRSLKLSLRSNDGRYLPGPAGFPSGGAGSPAATGLVWYNVRYRPWIDLRVGFNPDGSKNWDRTYLGIFVLTQPDVQVQVEGATVTLDLLDKSALLQKPYALLASNLPTFTKGGHAVGGYQKGALFDTVMRDLATRAGVPAAKLNFSSSALTLPADFAVHEGDEPWELLQTLAGSMAAVLYFDHVGNLLRRGHPLNNSNTPSAYTFAPGRTSIISEVQRKIDLQNTFNHVVSLGASTKGALVRGEAQLLDATSPYHKNQIGERITWVGKDGKLDDMTPDPTINTIAQANTRAGVVLALHIGRQETITIKGRNIPPLTPYDRFTVSVPQSGLNMDFFADKITWALAHDGMQIEASRWVTVGS
jgi:hypothetical protein